MVNTTQSYKSAGGESRFQKAMQRIDHANSEDPNREVVDGVEVPKELLYSQRMSHRLARLAPDASEELQIAVHAQHIRRWTIPRNTYPMDRDGYLRWRTDLGRFHAETTAAILKECGYDETAIARVSALIRKERFKADPEAQTLEDAACLVFLESYFADFARQHDDNEVLRILARTWKKMSDKGHEAAQSLSLSPETQSLVARALEGFENAL
jgi:hypothetical protein